MTRVELPDLGRWAPQRTDAQRWEPPRKLTVVVAPHPDDETLLSGGLIAHQGTRCIYDALNAKEQGSI